VSGLLTELTAKELEILKETVPGARRIGVLWNPTTPSHPRALASVDDAARKLGVEVIAIPAKAASEFDEAFSVMARQRVDAFLVVASPLTNSERDSLADLALEHHLPSVFVNKANVQAGGLMSYGPDFNYMYRHAAIYIDKILKGERPADLPVEQASKYQLVINLKTAKALGLEVPPSLLARADEVIE
jgi:ABC-type uncharacterized transport system substrate-binding protein